MSTRCTAKSKQTGERCRAFPVPGRSVCRHHGGLTPQGKALPQTTHGRYSKHLPTRMLANYEQAQRDPELLNLREDIALLDSRLAELLKRVDSGESGKVWRDLRAQWKVVKQSATEFDKHLAVAELGPLIDKGYLDTQAWGEIGGLLEQRRKLVESERKRLIEMQQMMTAGQAQMLIAAVYQIVSEHVSDRSSLAAIGAGLQALAGAGAAVPTGSESTDHE